MSLSANIKKFRLDNNMTQEQLSSMLGVSAQAVSKWETSETYPDGALLVPLAEALCVSLDELFDHEVASMADISKGIMTFIYNTEVSQRFNVVRDIVWQIERGLFNCHMSLGNYSPNEIKNLHQASYILNDYGFTYISNGKEPFFSVFPEPREGFGDFLNDREFLQKVFSALSHEDTMNAVIYLYRRPQNYVFESAVLAKDCGISDDRIEEVMNDLMFLRIIWEHELNINGNNRILYYSRPDLKLIALFLIAKEIGYKGSYCLTSHSRNTPLIR